MKKSLVLFPVLSVALPGGAGIFTNAPDADSFVRANAPAANYGGAGSLSVSGSAATNSSGVMQGVADSFLRFNTGAMVTSFNSLYGSNNWVIGSAFLNVTEVTGQMNAIFDEGAGAFAIRWIANTNWTEGSGTPGSPGSTGITYGGESSLLNSATDANLGTFTNSNLNIAHSFPLALPTAFANSLYTSGDTCLFLMALDSATGLTFNSRSFGTASARPYLVVSAAPPPGVVSAGFSGPNLILTSTNANTNAMYLVLTTTNLSMPASQWIPILTNTPNANGIFILTVATPPAATYGEFFIIRSQ